MTTKREIVIAPEIDSFDQLVDWLSKNINNALISIRLEEDGLKYFNRNCSGKTNEQIEIEFAYFAL